MFYQQSSEHILKELKTDPSSGLTHEEAKSRLTKYGENILPEKKRPPFFLKFLSQFTNFLTLILIISAVVSFVVGDALDGLVILTIVALNAIIGFVQEVNAEKNLQSLKSQDIQETLVLREKEVQKIPSREVVPGDIIILEEGEKITADSRVIEAFSLQIDESILTGESLPASKNPKEIEETVPLGDQKNMVFKDTTVISGRGKAIIVATGNHTEIGKIALFLQKEEDTRTPLTIELEGIGRVLTIVIGAIAGVIFILNIAGKVPVVESLLLSISLAVAAIPEGLPAIITIVLSLGVKRMAQKRTIVKNLPSVETLGGVRIIATDKTGTITQNKIRVTELYADWQSFRVQNDDTRMEATIFADMNTIVDPSKYKDLEKIVHVGLLVNNASFTHEHTVIGDTTDAALLYLAKEIHAPVDDIRGSFKRIFEVPFTSERKMMSVVVNVDNTSDHLLLVKGAPEVILPRTLLSEKDKQKILEKNEEMARQGLRTLALAERKIPSKEVKKTLEEEEIQEDHLTFLGLVGMQDPLRPEVRESIERAKDAGIRTIMITGDHKETARSIAVEAGITTAQGNVLTENEVTTMTDEELRESILAGTSVFARISPMGKLRLVQILKTLANTHVAVTGDGVNDAPALKAAHIGVAMGKSGTDLTREIADMVITDDNYATIIDAIREGRVIFANLVKFTRYLISCNISEVLLVTLAVVFATPIPLLPLQILWINLITDGLPALALGMDPPEYDVMTKPPRDLSLGILHKKRWMYMVSEGFLMGGMVFALFLYSLSQLPIVLSQTMAFTLIGFLQLIHAFNNRSSRTSVLKLGIFTNKILVLAVFLSVLLQVLVVQTDFGNRIFKTGPLSLSQWLLIGEVSILFFFLIELKKLLRFKILP